MGPFRPTGSKPFVRISDGAEKRLKAVQAWLRAWDEGERREAAVDSQAVSSAGSPNYSSRWRKEAADRIDI